MLRLFYRWLLRFHPTRFRERFAEEMLSIFDHVKSTSTQFMRHIRGGIGVL
jgi:hypothetical protein